MMNLDKFNSLDGDSQKVLLDAGYQLEKNTIGIFNELLKVENATMVAAGAKTTSIGYTLDEANALYSSRAMEVAVEQSGATGEAFRDFVASKGM